MTIGDHLVGWATMALPKRDLIKFAANACTVIDDNGYKFTFVYGYREETGQLQV